MRMKLRTLLLLLPFVAASCSDAFNDVSQPAGTINVTVGSDPGIDIQSRTALEPDGETVRWVDGDQIALWAVNAEGASTLSAHPFRMYHYNATFNTAKFTADIPVMPEGKYDYYAVSPQPLVTTGRMAAFEIPAEQEVTPSAVGEPVKIPCDIMISEPVSAADELTSGDNSAKINLVFRHKTHVLKIRIPENRMGIPISALELTFPQPVTGMLTFDAFDLSAAPQLTNAKNSVRLNFTKPVDAGMVVCASIMPVALNPDDEIIIKAYTETKESVPTRMSGKTFAEAHTTPIALTIPEIYRVTVIDFSLTGDGTETLGEKVNSFSLIAPAGTDLGTGTNTRSFAVNADNRYSLAYEGEFTDNLSGKELTVSYDSDNAIVSHKFTVPQITAEERNVMTPFSVPYLFEEDFIGVNGNGFDDTKGKDNGWGVALVSDGTNKSVDMNLPGWSGQRIGSKANTAVRINSCHYHGGGFSGASNYNGSLTSSPLTGIKSGKALNVKVMFLANRSSNNTLGYFGSTTATGHPTYSNSGQSAIVLTTKDGYDTVDTANEFPLTVTSAHRLWWNVTNNDSSGGFLNSVTNRHYLYIDNVKVSIVN